MKEVLENLSHLSTLMANICTALTFSHEYTNGLATIPIFLIFFVYF